MRRLYRLSKKVAHPIFSSALQRSLKYEIVKLESIEQICILLLRSNGYQLPLPLLDETFKNRPNFIDGEFSEDADLNQYDLLLDKKDG